MKPAIHAYHTTHFIGKNIKVPFSELAEKVQETLVQLHQQRDLDFEKLLYPAIQYLDTSAMNTEYGKIELNIGMATKTPIQLQGYETTLFPKGKYLVVTHQGSYDSLMDSNAYLQRYAQENDIQFQKEGVGSQRRWTSRLELYMKGVESDPNPTAWVTEVRYLIQS